MSSTRRIINTGTFISRYTKDIVCNIKKKIACLLNMWHFQEDVGLNFSFFKAVVFLLTSFCFSLFCFSKMNYFQENTTVQSGNVHSLIHATFTEQLLCLRYYIKGKRHKSSLVNQWGRVRKNEYPEKPMYNSNFNTQKKHSIQQQWRRSPLIRCQRTHLRGGYNKAKIWTGANHWNS